MSEGKLAAQVAHAVLGLRNNGGIYHDWDKTIVVLMASDKKFFDAVSQMEIYNGYLQVDWGLTELEEGTPTTVAFYEE